jgi:uncharacterized protein
MNHEVKPDHPELHHSTFIIHYSLFFLLLSLLFTSCKDIRKEYYPNGNLKQELTYKKGVLDGPSVWYFQDGKKMMECTYVAGNIEGKMTRWFYNGNYESEGYYSNNRQNGKSTLYFENGEIQIEQNYKNDTLNGTFVEYFPGKQVKTKGGYYMGLWEGKWEYYDDKGLLVGEGNFVKGTGILKGYYWNGRLKREVQYVNNQKDGTETWYKENGLLEKKLVFKQDKLVGEEK